jgi:hypothetical protein
MQPTAGRSDAPLTVISTLPFQIKLALPSRR